MEGDLPEKPQELDEAIRVNLLRFEDKETWTSIAGRFGVSLRTVYRHREKLLQSPVLREELAIKAAGDMGFWYNRHKQEKGMDAVKTAYELAGVYERKPQVQVQTNILNVSPEEIEERLEWIRKRKAERLRKQQARELEDE